MAAVSSAQLPISTSELAGKLREALTRSGVFYESHLADWAAGKEKTEQLLREPQGKLSPMNARPDTPPPELSAGATSTASAPGNAGSAASPGKSEAIFSEPADPQSLPVIRQQLALLNSGTFVWQGEAWRGQKMEWSVGEREPEAGDTPGRRWNTALAVDLPQLGRVRAELNLKDGRLKVTVNTEHSETALLLEQNVEKLREGLTANGLVLTAMAIEHEE